MRISVAICTWNRAQLLENALESIQVALERCPVPTQVIIVNNNSTDSTDSVISRFSQIMPVTRVFEPKPGVSNARNAAIAAATGDYIVWTDDDVVVAPNWLESYANAFTRHPEASFFGGVIKPDFGGGVPDWLYASHHRIGLAFAARDLGDEEIQITTPAQLPFGANFAIKTSEQLALRYDTHLGRHPDNYWLGGEETALLLNLLQSGAEGWWVPTAMVQHTIPKERQTLRYIWQFGFGLGQTAARTGSLEGRFRFLGRPSWLWRQFVTSIFRAAIYRAHKPPEHWVPAFYSAALATGTFYGRGKGWQKPLS